MFSFRNQRKTIELRPFIRRLCDLAAANPLDWDDARSAPRSNFSIPTVLCPWSNEGPELDKCITAMTKDVSDRGVSLILGHPISADECVVGFWPDPEDMSAPWFFRVAIRTNASIGGGFWQVGGEFQEFLDSQGNGLERLAVVAQKLIARDTPELA